MVGLAGRSGFYIDTPHRSVDGGRAVPLSTLKENMEQLIQLHPVRKQKEMDVGSHLTFSISLSLGLQPKKYENSLFSSNLSWLVHVSFTERNK